LGIPNLRETAIANLETALTPWLTGTNPDALLFDTTYGGIVTTDGIASPDGDYGEGWYNDHHFHYGYFVYAFATLLRFDPAFWQTYYSSIDMIVRDICTMTSSDPDFPFVRHKDLFDGHSWASGLFQEEDGKNQESSTEVNYSITQIVWC
jgi:endo-1,3(4)-beta-glucanase